MKNLDIRILVREKGLTYKRIAQKIGISPEWLSRLMARNSRLMARKLSGENRERILAAIEEIKREEMTE